MYVSNINIFITSNTVTTLRESLTIFLYSSSKFFNFKSINILYIYLIKIIENNLINFK